MAPAWQKATWSELSLELHVQARSDESEDNMARTSRRKSWLAASAAMVVLTSVVVTALIAPAANADGTPVSGNKNCRDLIEGKPELRIENPATGSYTDGTLTVALSVYTLAADDPSHPGNQTGSPVFDFTATGGSVVGIAVKGGPNTNFYDYRPNGVTSGTKLHAPVNPNNGKFYGLSHVSFCYEPKARTKIVTKVSADTITIGGSVTDTATLSGGNNPTGTITFKVYGPDDATCSGAVVFTSTVTVNGNGSYTSGAFTPQAVGTYRWIASYSGDAKNTASSGACGDQNEQVVVKKARPQLGTAPNLLPNDRATIAGLVAPSGGTLVFKLYLNGTCTGAPAYTETQVVNANGAFHTNNTSVRVMADATLSWIVAYSGDAKNEAATSACSDEQIVMDFTPLAP
jgi:hypothetical protein